MPSGSAVYAANRQQEQRVSIAEPVNRKTVCFVILNVSVSLGIPLPFCSFSASSDIPLCIAGHCLSYNHVRTPSGFRMAAVTAISYKTVMACIRFVYD